MTWPRPRPGPDVVPSLQLAIQRESVSQLKFIRQKCLQHVANRTSVIIQAKTVQAQFSEGGQLQYSVPKCVDRDVYCLARREVR